MIQELGSPGKVSSHNQGRPERKQRRLWRIYRMGLRRHKDQRTRTDAGNLPGKEKRGKSFQPGERSLWLRHRWKNLRRARAKADQGSTSAYEDNSSQERYERARRRAERGYHAEKKKNNAGIILVLILLVFISPFLSGAIGGVLGTIVAIILFPFILIFAFGICAVAFLIGGIACLAAGIALCVVHPAAGVLTIGIGCLLIAAGFLSLAGLTAIAGKLLPWLLNKFTDFCHNLLHREGKDGERV